MDLVIKVMIFLFLITGAILVYGAKPIVRKMMKGLDDRINDLEDKEHWRSKDDVPDDEEYNKRILNIKMAGAACIIIAGVLLIFITTR